LKREILISATTQETRVAILEDDTLVELMVDRPDNERIVGDIYLGQIQAVLPGIQAAFVDIGMEKAAFLHASDVSPDSGLDDEDDEEEDQEARDRRKYQPIQDMIQKGEKTLVQVSKEPISTKGPRVTTHISLPGRFLVYMPGSRHIGVSRKIGEREERTRLRQMAKEVVPEGEGGVIIRTVGER
jgi:ribonuclease G